MKKIILWGNGIQVSVQLRLIILLLIWIKRQICDCKPLIRSTYIHVVFARMWSLSLNFFSICTTIHSKEAYTPFLFYKGCWLTSRVKAAPPPPIHSTYISYTCIYESSYIVYTKYQIVRFDFLFNIPHSLCMFVSLSVTNICRIFLGNY